MTGRPWAQLMSLFSSLLHDTNWEITRIGIRGQAATAEFV